MRPNRKEEGGLWKILRAVVVGAMIGIGAGIVGTAMSNNDRETDLLTLRNRSQVQKKNPNQSNQQDMSEIYTQIDSFRCPITQEIMQQPMILSNCSHSFEKNVIVEWVSKHGDCPLCKAQVTMKDLRPNYSLKNAIQQIKHKTSKG